MAETTSERTMTVAGGATAEVIGGIGAVVLAIIGLANIIPYAMMDIATIVVGAALLLEGGAIAARFRDLTPAGGATSRTGTELGGGMSAEVLGGIAGIVLGALALAGIAPLTLVPVANIIFGGALLIGVAVNSGINRLRPGDYYAAGEHGGRSDVAHQALSAANGTQVMVGIGAIVLGILALLNIAPLVLSLVGLLAVGASVLLSGSAIGGRVVSFLGH